MSSGSSTRAPHAEIAGGGFAGLTAAVALRRQGWTVRIHEKGHELRALGAGIFLWHNGLTVLEAIGAYDDVMEGSVTPPVYETRIHDTSVSKETFGGLRWRTMTRPHLHSALVAAAVREGVDFQMDSEVVAADPKGSVTLASGRVLEADLVVGADGVGSKVRDSLHFKQTRTKSRDGIARFLVHRDKEFIGGDWDNVIDFWNFAPKVMRILYVPCNDDYLYLGLMAPREDIDAAQVPINLNVWTDMFPQLTPALERVARIEDGRSDRYETTVLDSWTKGKVALIGDAAHAMCPALAQGAGCGMVNALTLAAAVADPTDVSSSLRGWEQRERPVTDRCQTRSAWFAETRSMSRGNQFTSEVLETAKYEALRAAVSVP
jgi:2-methyl-3-hydroxypyridine 5-carboxylic acid dioxygenase